MKAILIDPAKREIRGIEVEPTAISSAFSGRNKTLLLTKMLGSTFVLYHDALASPGKHPMFWIQGASSPVCGKGLLFDRAGGVWPVASSLTVKEVEALVRWI